MYLNLGPFLINIDLNAKFHGIYRLNLPPRGHHFSVESFAFTVTKCCSRQSLQLASRIFCGAAASNAGSRTKSCRFLTPLSGRLSSLAFQVPAQHR